MVWLKNNDFAIRLIRMGCKNRPFYQFGALPALRRPGLLPDEVIGNVDPIPNEKNEIVASVDLKRLVYWMGKGGKLSKGTQNVLGLAGFVPIPPGVYIRAVENRETERGIRAEGKEAKAEPEEGEFVVDHLIAKKRLC